MKAITKIKVQRILLAAAIISFITATVEGIIFYSRQYSPFVTVLLVIQNSINTFAFKPTLAITQAVGFALETGNAFYKAVCYTYCVIVFVAPYCTMAFLYKLIEKAFQMVFFARKRRTRENIIIFGYNDDTRAFLKNFNAEKQKGNICIHIVAAKEFPKEEKYELVSKSINIHTFDCIKATYEELNFFFKRINIDRVSNIILFEDSGIQNFSLLQIFRLDNDDNKEKITLRQGAKITCFCDDENIKSLIVDFYDNRADNEAFYDLEIINLPGLQVHEMFERVPIYSYYENKDKCLDEWDVNMLIVGFSHMGRECLMNCMNVGVFSQNNKITVDVIDYDIDNKLDIFANCLSDETVIADNYTYRINPEFANGEFVINFHNVNVFHKQFRNILKGAGGSIPYNYVIIAIDDIKTSVRCAQEIEAELFRCKKSIPVFLQMDSDSRLVDYISKNKRVLPDVMVIPEKKTVISLEMILDKETDKKSKEYNYFYSTMQITEGEAAAEEDKRGIEERWNSLTLFRRDSNRAASQHEGIKKKMLDRLALETDTDLTAKISELVGTNGALLGYDGDVWKVTKSQDEFCDTIKRERLAYELAAAEHRRWCYFLISRGWKRGEKNDKFKSNPYLIRQEELISSYPNMIKYDLMFLLALYKRSNKNADTDFNAINRDI